MIRVMMLIAAATLLIACGLLDNYEGPGVTGEFYEGGGPLSAGDAPDRLYAGDTLVEAKIIRHQIVVRATMTSLSSEVVADADGKYDAVLKFNLAVSEYLKGTGPPSIVAIWVDGRSYDTRARADREREVILAERDAQWNDREAVIFLFDGGSGFGTLLDGQLQAPDHYLLSLGERYFDDDRYSLRSESHKKWLPAASSTSTGDSQEFLLDVPPPTETITLGELKRKIVEVTAELAGGDGSERYRECVLEKYQYIQNQRNWPEEMGHAYTVWNVVHRLDSGLPSGTVLDQGVRGGGYPDVKVVYWLEGGDSTLFAIVDGPSTGVDDDGDGNYDSIRYDRMIQQARPLPAGEYKFDLKEPKPRFAICNFVVSNEWTVAAVAAGGVVHEALFDPVTDGSAVAADSTNGVLTPASFIESGATTTIDRIEWEAGTAKMKLTPRTSLAGRVVDFIELDGTVSLSLTIDDATVDTANNTLSWSVSPQPWDDGDKLMLRIR